MCGFLPQSTYTPQLNRLNLTFSFRKKVRNYLVLFSCIQNVTQWCFFYSFAVSLHIIISSGWWVIWNKLLILLQITQRPQVLVLNNLQRTNEFLFTLQWHFNEVRVTKNIIFTDFHRILRIHDFNVFCFVFFFFFYFFRCLFLYFLQLTSAYK